MKVVKTYTDQFSAQLNKTYLESYGIQAAVLDEYMNLSTGMFNSDLLGIRLVVDDDDYEKAVKLLEEAQKTE